MPLPLILAAIALLALGAAIWLFITAARHRHRRISLLLLATPALCLLCFAATLVPITLGMFLGAVNVTRAAPFYDRPAPVPDSTIIYYLSSQTTGIETLGKGAHIVSPAGGDAHPTVTLNAFHGRTGKMAWQRAMPGATYLASDSDTVYAVSSAFDSNVSQVFALDLATGAVRWQETLQGLTVSSLLLAHDVLFLATVAPPGVLPFGHLLALHPSDGSRLWETPLSVSSWYHPSLSATADTLVVRNTVSSFQSLSLANGKVLWSDSPGNLGSIALGPHALYELSDYGTLVARNALTGTILWRYGTLEAFHSGVVSGDTLYVSEEHAGPVSDAHGNLTNPETLYALDAATGYLRWKFATRSGNAGAVLATTDTIYVHADDGIHALRASDGALRWHSDPNNNWTFALLPVTGPVLYVSALQYLPSDTFTLLGPRKGQRYLYAVNEADGTADWSIPVGPVVTIATRWTL